MRVCYRCASTLFMASLHGMFDPLVSVRMCVCARLCVPGRVFRLAHAIDALRVARAYAWAFALNLCRMVFADTHEVTA